MNKESYLEFYIELPPLHMEVFKTVLETHNICKVKDLVKMDEDEFRTLEGITPLMAVKTKALLRTNGYRFGMTDDDIADVEDESYFNSRPKEKGIALAEKSLLNDYLEKSGRKETDMFLEEHYVPSFSLKQSDTEEIETENSSVDEESESDEDTDVIDVKKEVDDETTHFPYTESKESIERQICDINSEIDKLRIKEYGYLSPLIDCHPCDFQWFRTYAILDGLRDDPWYIKLFCPYRVRVRRAIIKGNYFLKLWFEDAKFKNSLVTEQRESIKEQIKELEEKRLSLRLKLI